MKRKHIATAFLLSLLLSLSCSKEKKVGEALVFGGDWTVVSYVLNGTELFQPGAWTSATISFLTTELPPEPHGVYSVSFEDSNGASGYIIANYEVTDKGKTLSIDYGSSGGGVVVYELFVDDSRLELIHEASQTDILAER